MLRGCWSPTSSWWCCVKARCRRMARDPLPWMEIMASVFPGFMLMCRPAGYRASWMVWVVKVRSSTTCLGVVE
eukprot:10087858-Alexandrium_andersonii.AAC.1